MLFNSIEFILGISFGCFGINYAVDHNVSGPTIVEKNCTHATFSFEVQYVENPIRMNGVFYIYRSDGHHDVVLYTGINAMTGEFILLKANGTLFDNYTSFRVEPIPNTWRDKHTIYTTLRFLNDRDEYMMSVAGYLNDSFEEIKSPFKVGRKRCFPQDDIMGCDPYCLCDTVVQKICQDGSLISGKCSNSENLTDNSAGYIFNEACDTSSKPSSSESFSSNPSTSGSFSTNPSTSGSFSTNPSTSGSSSTITSSSGSFSTNPSSSGSFSTNPSSSGSFSTNPSTSGSSSTEPDLSITSATIGLITGVAVAAVAFVALVLDRKKKRKKRTHLPLNDESEMK